MTDEQVVTELKKIEKKAKSPRKAKTKAKAKKKAVRVHGCTHGKPQGGATAKRITADGYHAEKWQAFLYDEAEGGVLKRFWKKNKDLKRKADVIAAFIAAAAPKLGLGKLD